MRNFLVDSVFDCLPWTLDLRDGQGTPHPKHSIAQTHYPSLLTWPPIHCTILCFFRQYTVLCYTYLHYTCFANQSYTIQCSALLHFFTLYSALLNCSKLQSALPHSSTLRNALLYCLTLHIAFLNYLTLHNALLNCLTLHSLSYTVLHLAKLC